LNDQKRNQASNQTKANNASNNAPDDCGLELSPPEVPVPVPKGPPVEVLVDRVLEAAAASRRFGALLYSRQGLH